MKLIIAVVQDEDAPTLISRLTEKGYGATKLSSTGGFLRAGNTTLLIGVETEKLDGAFSIIQKVCHSRKQIAPIPSPIGEGAALYGTYPIEIMVGGATVFVLNIEQFAKY